MNRLFAILSVLATGTACFGPTCGAGTVKVDGECIPGASAGDTDAPADPDAPTILQFSANTEDLTTDGLVTFTAVVVDKQGIGDIIGGALETPAGRVYGAFATSADEGAYELTLSWATIDDTKDISFEGTEDRTFVARFFDQAGLANTAETSLELYCEDAQEIACAGACTDLRDDHDNCGACGRQCVDVFDSGSCAGTVCRGATACELSAGLSATETCTEVCAAIGAVCDSSSSHEVFNGDTCSFRVQTFSSCTAKLKDYATSYAAESFRCRCYQE